MNETPGKLVGFLINLFDRTIYCESYEKFLYEYNQLINDENDELFDSKIYSVFETSRSNELKEEMENFKENKKIISSQREIVNNLRKKYFEYRNFLKEFENFLNEEGKKLVNIKIDKISADLKNQIAEEEKIESEIEQIESIIRNYCNDNSEFNESEYDDLPF